MKNKSDDITISPAPLHHYFFLGIVSLSFLLMIALLPLLLDEGAIPIGPLGIGLLVLFFSSVGCYLWLFVNKRSIKDTILQFAILLAVLHPFVFGVHHWKPLTDASELIPTMHLWENINLVFGFTVLAVTTLSSYSNAYFKSDRNALVSFSTLEWTLFSINLKKLTYGRHTNFPIVHAIYWPLIIFGIVYLLWFANLHIHHQHLSGDLKLIVVIGMCSMILCYLGGLVFGEGIRLIQIEKQLNRGTFYDAKFAQLLRWRHDYVKYHLPYPIRKLNLHLFNQHVEAYERLQNKVKTSRI